MSTTSTHIHSRSSSSRTHRKHYIVHKLKTQLKEKKAKDRANRKKPAKYLINTLKTFLIIFFILLVGVLVGCVSLAVIVKEATEDLKKIDPNSPFKNIGKSGDSYIYSRDGVELRRLSGLESKDFISIKDIPDHVKAAAVAAEDKSYYENKGIDFFAMLRAISNTVFGKNNQQGGSTITQQVVKNTLVGDEKSLPRKIKEVILAAQIGQKYSKEEILQLYLNSISFGSNFVGIKRAAQAYFNKEVKDLTYAEAALIVGIPNEPSRLAPEPYNANKNNEEKLSDGTKIKSNIKRQREILQRMEEITPKLIKEQGMVLDIEQVKSAKDQAIVYNFPKVEQKAPHFIKNGGVVYEELREIFKDKANPDAYISSGGLRVYTTLDYGMQQKGEVEAAKVESFALGAKNSMVFSVDPKSGAVLSYVGSKDFYNNDPYVDGQVDIIKSPISQGSSMKPFTYLNTFVNKGYSPSTRWADVSLDFGGYRPRNYGYASTGKLGISTEEALLASLNVPAVQAAMAGGLENYGNLMKKLGYNDEEVRQVKEGLASTLGSAFISPWSHMQAHQILVNGGIKQDLYTVEKVTDREGNILYEKKHGEGQRVIDERHAWMVVQMMQKYVSAGTLRNEGYDAGGKTGTYDGGPNSEPTSVVFWGFTPNLITGVWAGNSRNQPINDNAIGENIASKLWTPYMRQVLPAYPKDRFVRPNGIVYASICSDTGFLSSGGCPTTSGMFLEGQLPKADRNHFSVSVVNCNGTVKLARPSDIKEGKATSKTFVVYETATDNPYIQRQINQYSPRPPTTYCN